TLPPPILAKIFAARPGEAFSATGQGLAVAVGKLEAVRAPQMTQMAQYVPIARNQLAQAVFGDFADGVERHARRKFKVSADAAKAREALGLEPAEDAKPAPAKGKAK
ncbi:MAG TPA: hypothetical protein VIO94_09790, partial [Phenylobacterium sp.]